MRHRNKDIQNEINLVFATFQKKIRVHQILKLG